MEHEYEQNTLIFQTIRFEHSVQRPVSIDDRAGSDEIVKIRMITDDVGFEGECIGENMTANSYDENGNLTMVLDNSWDRTKGGDLHKSSCKTTFQNYYDQKNNLVKIIEYQTREGFDDEERIHVYENNYDEYGRLTRVVETVTSIRNGEQVGEHTFTISYSYSMEQSTEMTIVESYEMDEICFPHASFDQKPSLGHIGRLLKKEIGSSFDMDEMHLYQYDQEGVLHTEEIWINQELSYCYRYEIIEEGTLKRTFASPAKGIYKWKLVCDPNLKDSCQIFPINSFLNVEMIQEIVDYFLEVFGDRMEMVIIGIVYINSTVSWETYQSYEKRFGIRLIEDW